jgi:STE24 endopeptidase
MEALGVVADFFGPYPLYRQSGWDKQQADDQFPYLGLTILFGIMMFLFESYIDIRQLQNFYTIKTLPKEIKGVVSEDTFKKSSHYGGDKLFFSRFESVFSFVFALVLLLAGWFPYAWDLSLVCTEYTSNNLLKRELSPLQNEILTTIIFVVLTSIVDTLFSLPFSLYSTFVIEQRHGFNKTVRFYFIWQINFP